MAQPLKDAGDQGNPNKVGDFNQVAKMGSALSRNAAHSALLAVSGDAASLPEGRKAAQVLEARATAGTATGPLTPVDYGATPAAGEIAVSAAGDLEFAAADGVTECEVVYMPMEGDVIEENVPVASSAASVAQGRRVRMLLEAEVLQGASAGTKTVANRGATPAAGEVAAADDGTLAFNAADVVAGEARVKYIAFPGVGTGVADSLAERLDGDVNF